MKELKQYVCDVCGTTYKDKRACEECEGGHVHPVKIDGATWASMKGDGSGYPARIHIKMSNGETITYKRY